MLQITSTLHATWALLVGQAVTLSTPPQDHLACGLSDCLLSSRSAVQFPVFRNLVYELTAGQLGTGFAWKLYMLRSGHPGLRYQGCFGLAPGNAERCKSFFSTLSTLCFAIIFNQWHTA